MICIHDWIGFGNASWKGCKTSCPESLSFHHDVVCSSCMYLSIYPSGRESMKGLGSAEHRLRRQKGSLADETRLEWNRVEDGKPSILAPEAGAIL